MLCFPISGGGREAGDPVLPFHPHRHSLSPSSQASALHRRARCSRCLNLQSMNKLLLPLLVKLNNRHQLQILLNKLPL
ncbi:hypothetical protein LINPERHAP2_LOCUS6093 [Linum perenne]